MLQVSRCWSLVGCFSLTFIFLFYTFYNCLQNQFHIFKRTVFKFMRNIKIVCPNFWLVVCTDTAPSVHTPHLKALGNSRKSIKSFFIEIGRICTQTPVIHRENIYTLCNLWKKCQIISIVVSILHVMNLIVYLSHRGITLHSVKNLLCFGFLGDAVIFE